MIQIPAPCLNFETSFLVMPKDTNYMQPLIFGGVFMAQLDIAAASLVHRCVAHSQVVNNAVTYKASFEFVGPANQGDLVVMVAKLTEAKGKHLCITVDGTKEEPNTLTKILVVRAHFVFVTRNNNEYLRHDLTI